MNLRVIDWLYIISMKGTVLRAWLRLNCVLFSVLLLISLVNAQQRAKTVNSYLVYVGTYSVRGSQGIYAFRFDSDSGKLYPLGLRAEAINPSFLVVDRARHFLYAVSEVSDYGGEKSGAILAYNIDQQTAQLKLVNQIASIGAGPCYLSFDKSGKYLLVANYQGGSVAAFPILTNGGLGNASAFIQHHGSGADPVRQGGPHAHAIATTPDNRFAIAADLGLDRLLLYRFGPEQGSLLPNQSVAASTLPGAGPRHFVFHPKKQFLYAINELASTITEFRYDSNGEVLQLTSLQTTSTLPKGFSGHNEAADLHVDAAGKFLYASNRGHDTIETFAIDANGGNLSPVGEIATGGKTPRNFAIDPTGRFLLVANEDSDNLVTLRVDRESGKPNATGVVAGIPSPVCVAFVTSN